MPAAVKWSFPVKRIGLGDDRSMRLGGAFLSFTVIVVPVVNRTLDGHGICKGQELR